MRTVPFPLDVRFVRDAEAKLGLRLPLGYVARMCQDNGGSVAVGRDAFVLHPILDTSDRKRLARTCNDIIRETAAARQWRGFPPDALVVGDNGGGDLLVLLPDPAGGCFADPVYWWDHETGELHPAADAFEELA
jgi:hypothetical protein